jgi:hypothetical protein
MVARVVGRVAGVVGGAALAVGLVAAPSQARTVVIAEEVPWAFFYDDFVTGDGESSLILYTGGSVEDECTMDYPIATNRVRLHGDPPAAGATQVERFVTRGDFHLYEGNGLDAVEYAAAVCETLAAGGEAPEPVAVGSGTVRSVVEVAFAGPTAPPDVTTANTAVGVVETPDGDHWAVRGEAELTLSPEFSVDHVDLEVRGG